MKKTVLLTVGCFFAYNSFYPAIAQTAPPLLKSSPRSTRLGGSLPRVDVQLHGETVGELRQVAGPRSGFSSLAALPILAGAGTPTEITQIERAADSGLPVFIKMSASPATGAVHATAEPRQTSLAFLQALAGPLQMQRPDQEFAVVQVGAPDALGQTHVRLQQVWQGLPVYGAEVVVHLDKNGQPALFTGRYFRSPSPLTSLTPLVSAQLASGRAETALRTKTTVSVLSPQLQQLLQYHGPESELVVYHPTPSAAPVLAWHITTRPTQYSRWESLVDARSGAVVQQYESSCSVNGPRTAAATDLNGVLRTFNTYEWSGQFYLLDGAQPMFNLAASSMPGGPVGGLMTFDAGNAVLSSSTVTQVMSPTNTWTAASQRSAVSAHFNMGIAYNYFRTTHSRSSIDGAGGTMISVVRVPEANGQRMDNATWNGRFISYGEGNTLFRPLAGALDVAGHEMTHGVVSSTARLEYLGQSGAINESMADVFGCAMDPADWNIGEDITLTSFIPTGVLRSFTDPHNGSTNPNANGYQPRTMAEYKTGSADNYGVHANSGIVNWAYYKFATAISRAHGEQIWYRALTTYLTRSSQFIDLRLAVIQSAIDLYGATSADVAAARTAFDQVGILGTTPTPVAGNLPVNPGQDYVLSYDTNPSVTGTWYRTSTTGTAFQRLANTEARCRASVNDRGTSAVYVDAQGRIRSLSLLSPFAETIVQNQPIWKSAALSKDGTKIAAVTVTADTAIYLFNLPAGTVARAQLYNPTNTTGVRGSGVRYADALEWDYSGEYLIYDAYNTLPSTTSAGISYWDIGIMRVWNNAQNSWGDGTIEKLIANLPAGVSIGNPVLAKVSPKVMAFDVLNANGGATPFSVVATNVDTGVSGVVVAQNHFAGTPSYSKLDDKLLFTAKSTAGDTVVAVVNLQSNKVLPSGSATVLINQAKWGAWYTQGQRVLLGTRAVAETLPGLAVYPNPVQDQLAIEWTSSLAVELTLYDVMGRVVRSVPATSTGHASLSVSGLPAGTYVLRVSDGQLTATRRITKE